VPATEPTPLAELIARAFAAYYRQFRTVTRRARGRFERREWRAAQADASERLTIYRDGVKQTVNEARAALDGQVPDAAFGRALRSAYAERIAQRAERELAETFYNSVVRRVFRTVGVNEDAEFAGRVVPPAEPEGTGVIYRPEEGAMSTAALLSRALRETGFEVLFADLESDARLSAERVDRAVERAGGGVVDSIELLAPIFYRGKGAYLVGCVRYGRGAIPLLLALRHPDRGVVVDAVLTDADDVSIVFGFTRSYFQADIDYPAAVVRFLREILPLKRTDELYTTLGYHKHGKRELFQELMRQLEPPGARFERAEGERGMVMSVFTLPSFNVVFKVIRDRFAFPKESSREQVMRCYEFVFRRDRVGRLADAQEFEHLELERRHFEPTLLEELLSECTRTVRLEGARVVIEHLYTERRVVPLDLYVRSATGAAAREAILDYGAAIRELAAAGIFPGDMLLKNFGVTRHGRVIFYDYDELGLLTDYHFRRIPAPHDATEEMSAEPFFHVEPHDVFPEEFRSFLVPEGPLREVFLSAHAELLDVRFWREMQERQRGGEVVDVLPYGEGCRLRRQESGDRSQNHS
jgi:isocitrate dehydrogenase kinase/phosphatase